MRTKHIAASFIAYACMMLTGCAGMPKTVSDALDIVKRETKTGNYWYKNSKSYDKANPRIQDVREWSVDGTQSDAIEWVRGMLGQETK